MCQQHLIPTFRSLGREKIELTKGRAKQAENALMKRLQPQDPGLPLCSQTNVQEINAFKALKNPTHGWTLSGLVDLVRKGLRGGEKLAAKVVGIT